MKNLSLALLFCLALSATAQEETDTLNAVDVDLGLAIFDVNYTQQEIELMLNDVNQNRDAFKTLRKNVLNNAVAPANVFQPIVPKEIKASQQAPLVFSSYKGTIRPPHDYDMAYFTVGQLHELLVTKQVTSVTLTQLFINRIKQHNDTLQCVITITEELAMEQARRADEEIAAGNIRGPLHGIPYGAKDLLSTKKYKTTWGATPYKDQVIDEDAVVIQKLEEAGAVLIAKTTLGALAWGDVWFNGTTKNPWNTKNGSSGSSAGSASGVSAGLFPFAIGTETLGSIVSPSTVCGATGLRPTFGRVSRTGAMALSWSMDKIGPITRSSEDTAMVLAALTGNDTTDPAVTTIPFNYNASAKKKLRIGYEKAAFEGEYRFKKNDSLALLQFEKLGYELIPIEFPELQPITSIILITEAAAAFEELTLSNSDNEMVRQVANAWPNVFRSAQLIPATQYVNANRHRRLLMEQMDSLFTKVDVIIHPSWASNALSISNLTGHPALVMPNGFSEEGAPTSISLMGQLYKEEGLITLGKAYQDATTFDNMHPPKFSGK